MKTAQVVNDNGYIVNLFKDDELFGYVELKNHSKYYADEVADNWLNGTLQENNEFIMRNVDNGTFVSHN